MTDRYEPILPPEALDPEYGVTDADRKPRPTHEEWRQGVLELLDEFLADDPEYDRRVWPALKEALDEHRPAGRKLFREHEPHPA